VDSLQQAQAALRRYDSFKERFTDEESDLYGEPLAWTAVAIQLDRLFRLDFAKVEIAGTVSDGDRFSIFLCDGQTTVRSAEIHGLGFGGECYVCSDGPILAAVGDDFIGTVLGSWNRARGNPRDAAMHQEVIVRANGSLEIRATPLEGC
jgi:hypothetical protein